MDTGCPPRRTARRWRIPRRHAERLRMPVANLNGIAINYEEHGDPQGPPILLTHAYAATLQMWRPQLEAWSAYRVIGWDMRGHGGTESPPEQDQYTEKLT